MTASRDPDRLIHAFLNEGLDELPDPVYDAVRDRIEQTRQRAFIGPWRTSDMNRYLKIGLAAAAVVVIAVVSYQFLGNSNTGGPGATETPQPASSPTAIPEPSVVGLPLGPYTLVEPGGQWDIGMTVTIGAADWNGPPAGGILTKNDNPDPPNGAGMIVFTGQLEVYGDPCHWQSTRPDPMTGATVDEVIAALAAQSLRNATEPVDVTVDGYSGKSIQLSVPSDSPFKAVNGTFLDCDRGEFRSWGPEEDSRYHQGPGQIDQVWVVDVDGTLATIDAAWYPETLLSDRAELDAILDSLTFEVP